MRLARYLTGGLFLLLGVLGPPIYISATWGWDATLRRVQRGLPGVAVLLFVAAVFLSFLAGFLLAGYPTADAEALKR